MTDDEQPVVPSEREVRVDGSTTHSVTVTTPPVPPRSYVVWRRRPTFFIIGGLVLAVILMFVAFWRQVNESNATIAQNSEVISDLNQQLEKARSEISDVSNESAERETCRLRFSSAITEGTSRVLLSFTAAAGNPSQDEAVRTQQRAVIAKAGDALDKALADREAYEKDGAPLPCPKD